MTSRSRPGPVTGFPSAITVPLSGFSKPAMMLSKVDFPQPLAPTRQTNSPSPTFRLTLSKRQDRARCALKLFETFSIASFEGGMTSELLRWLRNVGWRASWTHHGVSISFEVSVEPFKKPASFPSCTALPIKSRRYFACELNSLPRLRDGIRRKNPSCVSAFNSSINIFCASLRIGSESIGSIPYSRPRFFSRVRAGRALRNFTLETSHVVMMSLSSRKTLRLCIAFESCHPRLHCPDGINASAFETSVS